MSLSGAEPGAAPVEAGWFGRDTYTLTLMAPLENGGRPGEATKTVYCRSRQPRRPGSAAGSVKSGTVPVCGVTNVRGKAEGRMRGVRLITWLYAIFFVLLVLIVISSFFGVFDNPFIDPGL